MAWIGVNSGQRLAARDPINLAYRTSSRQKLQVAAGGFSSVTLVINHYVHMREK